MELLLNIESGSPDEKSTPLLSADINKRHLCSKRIEAWLARPTEGNSKNKVGKVLPEPLLVVNLNSFRFSEILI